MASIRVVAGGSHDKGGKTWGHILEAEPIGLVAGLICLWN